MLLRALHLDREIPIRGGFVLPKSLSMESEEDRAAWSVAYDHGTGLVEATSIHPRSPIMGSAILVPRERVVSMVVEHEIPLAIGFFLDMMIAMAGGEDEPEPAKKGRRPRKVRR